MITTRSKLQTIFLAFAAFFIQANLIAQSDHFTHQDTLRGSITPERAWWDLTYYHLDIRVNPADSSIHGTNTVQYRVLEESALMQIDLQPPLKITKIEQDGGPLPFNREGNVYYIRMANGQKKGAVNQIIIHYEGRPIIAKRAPWDGGFSWKKDKNGIDFIATSCQGEGASMWWPCKDHMYDEPDSMLMSITVPEHLTDVSNGRLRKVDENGDGTKTFHWFVSNPINNYGVNVNIGDYVHFSEKHPGEKGELDCDYYVLRDNLEIAKEHFKDARKTLEALEHWFGPYPFYEDGYKLVEVPYLGMEHQSSVTYGNDFKKGYKGRDLSETGHGLVVDFIILHESGHEWFANNITYKDMADMWVHEGFTAYSENLFLNFHYGKDACEEYVIGTRALIQNKVPLIAPYNVNRSSSVDIYYKGSNLLHTLRQIVNDDEKWRNILRGLNKDFYHQTVTTAQIENYIDERVDHDLTTFFDQYLRDTRIPTLEYRFNKGMLTYRWTNCINGFSIPLKLWINGKETWVTPTQSWQSLPDMPKGSTLKIDRNFYVAGFNLTGV